MRYARQSAIALLLTLALLNTACPKKENLIFWGEQVTDAASDVIIILKANGRDTTKAERFRDYGVKLVAAIKANNGTALGYAASAIEILDQVAIEVQQMPDTNTKKIALAILGIANIALHRLVSSLPESAGQSNSREAEALERFRAKKRWRCRDSVNGRYAKMEYCRANPATTTVETN